MSVDEDGVFTPSPMMRIKVPVPHSVLSVIDREIARRVNDGEHTITRTHVATEFLRLAARIKEKQLDGIKSNATDPNIRIEQQLAYIARELTRTRLKIDTFYRVFDELNQVDPNIVKRILSEVKLTEKEKLLLNELFIQLES